MRWKSDDTYCFASFWFLRILGLAYLSAFLSLWVQLDGLIGSRGILPAQDFIEAVRNLFGDRLLTEGIWAAPSVFLFGSSDSVLHWGCALGSFLSCLFIIGFAPNLTALALWILYLSFTTVAGTFFGFQWDNLGDGLLGDLPSAFESLASNQSWMATANLGPLALSFPFVPPHVLLGVGEDPTRGRRTQHLGRSDRAKLSLRNPTSADPLRLVRSPIARVVRQNFGGPHTFYSDRYSVPDLRTPDLPSRCLGMSPFSSGSHSADRQLLLLQSPCNRALPIAVG